MARRFKHLTKLIGCVWSSSSRTEKGQKRLPKISASTSPPYTGRKNEDSMSTAIVTGRRRSRYSPDIAHDRYRENLKAKGPELKLGKDRKLAEYIEHKIADEQYSPAAVLGRIKAKGLKFNTTISVNTLYSYIEKGVFLRITTKISR